ncbi:MAG: hypothetical protein SX243_21675 [Acidobacteriota bacterium]|nr:hypothetical protein [Acidobacteriota bacterium]
MSTTPLLSLHRSLARRHIVLLPILLAAALCLNACAYSQQGATLSELQVENPAFPEGATDAPLVLIDEAHKNFHTADDRYKPFAQLLRADGLRVQAGKEPFSAESLGRAQILVIANVPPADDGYLPFTGDEIDAVEAWVEAGGGLLLVADHAPFGGAAALLAERFGVGMADAWTIDAKRTDPETGNIAWLRFTAANEGLAEHPILAGRSAEERVSSVLTFAGQSLLLAEPGTCLLQLSEQARDLPDRESLRLPPEQQRATGVSAAGRCQAVALDYGEGRVVMSGEAAALTAQVASSPSGSFSFGFTTPGTDNRQFVLNLARWLAGVL